MTLEWPWGRWGSLGGGSVWSSGEGGAVGGRGVKGELNGCGGRREERDLVMVALVGGRGMGSWVWKGLCTLGCKEMDDAEL